MKRFSIELQLVNAPDHWTEEHAANCVRRIICIGQSDPITYLKVTEIQEPEVEQDAEVFQG